MPRLLNKHNLEIAKLCAKEGSRFTLQALHVTPEYTEVTNGHQLTRVTIADWEGDFPEKPGITLEADESSAFLLSQTQALRIAKAIPKTPIPLVNNAAVCEAPDGHSALVVTDLDSHHVFEERKPEGTFPDTDRAIDLAISDKDCPMAEISLNLTLLLPVLQQLAKFITPGDFKRKEFTLSVYGPNNAIRIDAEGNNGQRWLSIVMPLQSSEKK